MVGSCKKREKGQKEKRQNPSKKHGVSSLIGFAVCESARLEIAVEQRQVVVHEKQLNDGRMMYAKRCEKDAKKRIKKSEREAEREW